MQTLTVTLTYDMALG